MTKIRSINRFLLSVAAACGLWGCQSDFLARLGVDNPMDMFESAALPGGLPGEQSVKREKMVVNRVDFSPDYKHFSVWTGVVDDIGPYPLTDSTVVRIELQELLDGVPTSANVKPRLVKALNTEGDKVKEMGAKVLVLVDLSLSDEQIDAQKNAVEEIRTVFDQENLYVAFMSNTSVTPTRELTDYIRGAYFKKWSDQKSLYRSVLTKLKEMNSGTGPWADARQLNLVVFSDGAVYGEDNAPMDPEHFTMENELLHVTGGKTRVYYVDFGKGTASEGGESADVMSSVCAATGGAYLTQFGWTVLESSMLGPDFQAKESNRFDFENPDGKVYRGGDHQLRILFYSVQEKNKLVASATAKVRVGSLYKPIIVNGDPVNEILLEGLAAGLLIMLIVYLVFQFLIPYIRYRLFLRKYVVEYTGKNMMVEGHTVGESCYLCKSPFVKGDQIVVKCQHTMHKSCWDENQYHCPEYGRHCKEGSHFYDKEHLFDKRNASFYMRWILMAVAASICAWVAFSIWNDHSSHHMLEPLFTDEAYVGMRLHMNQLPSYCFSIGFFLTLGICLLAIPSRRFIQYLGIFLRALIVGIGSALLYLLMSAACIALRIETGGLLVNLIPWILSSFLIAFVSTYGTRIKLKKYIVLVAVGVSFVSLYLWSALYMSIGVDYRVLLLYSYILYSVGLALAIAGVAPRSEHYFLHVQGAVKTMDIALYKWFRSNPSAVVSIGKSVDCSLQLSWDLQGRVAPVHAEISQRKGVLRLIALEEGVLIGKKPLPPDKAVNLYHGMSFQIGQTLFTYQEKDL